LPGAGSDDLRKNRSIFNNIILTTTGAAKALQLVIPEMKQIGFSAESVRIPTNTGSIVILMMNIQSEETGASITPESINIIFEEAAKTSLSRYISYTERQNVSTDVIGTASAAIIEGRETRVETEPVRVRLNQSCAIVPEGSVDANTGSTLEIPVNQVVVYGWYDNELGSFCNMMGERTLSVAQKLL
jgi:glyceraldehyde 3-phosphate dehydrogenase